MGLIGSSIGLRIVVSGASTAGNQLNAFGNSISGVGKEANTLGQNMQAVGTSIKSLGQIMTGTGLALTAAVTVPLIAATRSLVTAGIEFEDTFAGIAKTIEGVADVSAAGNLELTALGETIKEDIRAAALNIPIAATELNELGMIAGQLGVRGSENLRQFIDVTAKLGVATDLEASRAAFALARLFNVLGGVDAVGMQVGEFAARTGAAITELGNTTAATESEITELSLRVAGAARISGLTTPQILGWADAAAQMGIRAESGGTAISRIFQEIQFAVDSGVDETTTAIRSLPMEMQDAADGLVAQRNRLLTNIARTQIDITAGNFTGTTGEDQLWGLQEQLAGVDRALSVVDSNATIVTGNFTKATSEMATFAAVAGMSVSEFSALFKEDASRAVEIFLVSLSKLQEEGNLTEDQLKEMGFSGVRVRDVINRMTGTVDYQTGRINILSDAIDGANKAYEEATALNEEAERKFATFASQIQLVKNRFFDLGITIFDLIRDDLEKLLDFVTRIIDGFINLDPEVQSTILAVLALAAVLGPMLLILGAIVTVIGSFLTALGGLLAIGPALLALLGGIAVVAVGAGGVGLAAIFQQIKDAISQEAPEAIEIPVRVAPVTNGGANSSHFDQQDAEEFADSMAEDIPPVPVAVQVSEPSERIAEDDLSAFVTAQNRAIPPVVIPVRAGLVETLENLDQRDLINSTGSLPVAPVNPLQGVISRSGGDAAAIAAAQQRNANLATGGPGTAAFRQADATTIGQTVGTAGFRQAEADNAMPTGLDLLEETLAGIRDILAGIETSVSKVFDNPELEDAIGRLDEAWNTFLITLEESGINVDIFKGGILELATSIATGLLTAIIDIIDFGTLMFIGLTNLIDLIPTAALTILTIGVAISDLIADSLLAIGTWATDVWDEFIDLSINIIESVSGWLIIIKDSITTTIGEVKTLLGTWKDDIIGFFRTLKTKIVGFIDTITGKLAEIGSAALRLLSELTGSPELKIQHPFEMFEEYLKTADFNMSVGANFANVPQVPSTSTTSNISNSRTNQFNISGVPMSNEEDFTEMFIRNIKLLETAGSLK